MVAAAAAGLTLGMMLGKRRTWSFRDKVVLVTGGSRGLGLVLARQLAAEGARLALLARSAEDLEAAAQSLANYGVPVLTLPADVQKPEQVEQAVREILSYFGRLDVLINNAGVIQVGPLENMDLADFDETMSTHFWGPLHAMRAAIPHMKRQGGGHVVNVASIGGKIAVPHLTPYSASKFALVGLSDGFRAEYAKDNILVTTVCPWLTRTGSYRNVDVKGQHQQELAWFALGDSLPFMTMKDEDAAKQILAACRRGSPRLILSPFGKTANLVDAVLPQLSAALMTTAAALLPRAMPRGNQTRKGFDSFSSAAPSRLTKLSDSAAQRNNQIRKSKTRR